MTTATPGQYQRAIDKALSLGGSALVVHRETLSNGVRRFWVKTTSGRQTHEWHCLPCYLVQVVDGEYTCSCPAGYCERACYHQSAVWLSLHAPEGATRVELVLAGRP